MHIDPPVQLTFLEGEKRQLSRRKITGEWELTTERAKRPLDPPTEALKNELSLPPSESGKLLPGDIPNVQPPIPGFEKGMFLEINLFLHTLHHIPATVAC